MDKTTEDSIWHLKALSEFYTPHSLSFYSVSTGLYKESYTAFMAAVQRARMVVIYGVPLGEGEKEEDFMVISSFYLCVIFLYFFIFLFLNFLISSFFISCLFRKSEEVL